MSKKFKIVQEDSWLDPYNHDISERNHRFDTLKNDIIKSSKSLSNYALGHKYFGLNHDVKSKKWSYREWAPGANAISIFGDFNNWNKESHPLKRIDGDVWEVFIDDKEVKVGSEFKVFVQTAKGGQDRIPAYATYVVQNPDTHDFTAVFRDTTEKFKWTDSKFNWPITNTPIIYECHVGMALEEERVGTYKEFSEKVLPRIAKQGYNVIQMMAVQEHPYYGSFGYHVSSFFAPSSRFGTPADLKALIDKAHSLGIAVLIDIVHSHAVKNIAEGLNDFDGTDNQYFHHGDRGLHPQWDSKVFNYGKPEVRQFLLSNLRYWIEEFHFDGFRFDGVTSMLYHHHGTIAFNHYDKYFKDGVEWDAISYLQLANELIKELNPNALSIAEDMSGMPGLCRTTEDGGIGFDYRLGMGIPDFWIKILKHQSDEQWNLEELWNMLINRRPGEKTIAYAESHDQALVGDKSLSFWLMDKEMYWKMDKASESTIIDRGIALHKLIRLVTMAAGGEGYLNFIGNEFGHPEWVDFPREGNNWSYKYCKRQWSLVDNKELKYEYLNNFDRAMISILRDSDVLSENIQLINMDHQNKVLIFERGGLIFVFNFHVSYSIPDYKFWVPKKGNYKIVLDSDQSEFGGFDRLDRSVKFSTDKEQMLSIYNVNRAVQVFKKSS